jgi:hypothetical protein
MDESRRTPLVAVAMALAFIVIASPCTAGPCTKAIIKLQAKADAAIEAHARSGPGGRQGTDAFQPTPASIARADAKLSGWTGGERALAALGRAREADDKGDRRACRHALRSARRALRAT